MPLGVDEYLAQKKKPLGVDEYLASSQADTGLAERGLMDFLPEPVSSLAIPETRQEQLPILPGDEDPISTIEDLMIQIPRVGKQLHPKAEAGRIALNALLGGAELTANMPAFIFQMLALGAKAPFEPKESFEEVKDMAEGLVDPLAKFVAGEVTRGESKAGKELSEEAREELKQHPEAAVLPFLISTGLAKGAKKLAGKVKAKIKSKP